MQTEDVLAGRLSRVTVDRIAVIKPTALGDVVQSMPVLGALRERFPDANISWVISSGLQEILAEHPLLHETIVYERHGGFRGWRRLLAELRSRRFDLVLDLQGLLRTGLMTWATGAPVRIGLESAREGSSLACHGLVPHTGRLVPAHQRYWQVAEFLGCGHVDRRQEISVSCADGDLARSVADRLGSRVVALHAGARWETKRWPVEKFAQVALHAITTHDASIVLVGGEEEVGRSVVLQKEIEATGRGGRVENLVGRTGLKQLAAVLARSEVLVTGDSGPMHMAAAMGTPVVGLFTCTSAERSGPPPGQHVLIETALPCRGSYFKRCPMRGASHMACLRDLSVSRACEGLDRLLERDASRSAA